MDGLCVLGSGTLVPALGDIIYWSKFKVRILHQNRLRSIHSTSFKGTIISQLVENTPYLNPYLIQLKLIPLGPAKQIGDLRPKANSLLFYLLNFDANFTNQQRP